MKNDGNPYDFKASRNCTRCKRSEYFYTDWQVEVKSPLDYESRYYASHKININEEKYS
jgi:hypothetical protein